MPGASAKPRPSSRAAHPEPGLAALRIHSFMTGCAVGPWHWARRQTGHPARLPDPFWSPCGPAAHGAINGRRARSFRLRLLTQNPSRPRPCYPVQIRVKPARAWKAPPGTASKTGLPFTGCGAHAYSPSHRPNGSPAESCAAEARACKRIRSLPGNHARARVGCRMGPAPEP
jgi:hypothetical protein